MECRLRALWIQTDLDANLSFITDLLRSRASHFTYLSLSSLCLEKRDYSISTSLSSGDRGNDDRNTPGP